MKDKKTILIVDDEVDLVEALKFLLTDNGYSVLTAYDGEVGLQIVYESNLA